LKAVPPTQKVNAVIARRACQVIIPLGWLGGWQKEGLRDKRRGCAIREINETFSGGALYPARIIKKQ
jgi:hypothetical protein